jgi:hypothetical protein
VIKIVFPSQKYIRNLKDIDIKQGEFEYSDPLVVPQKHYEGHRTHVYGSILKLDDVYKMYYQCGNALRVGLAESKDGGNTWQKPITSKAKFDGQSTVIQAVDTIDDYIVPELSNKSDKDGEETNLVSTLHMPSVVYDKNSTYPYKMFGYGEGGYRVEFSKDGINFEDYENNPVMKLLEYPNEESKKTWYSDVSPVFKDYHQKKYVAMTKTYEIDKDGLTRRCVGYSESTDFKNWSEVKTVWQPDDSDDKLAKEKGFNWADFYGLCAFNYADYYMGLLWMFNIEKELPQGTHVGKMEVYLAYSEDGKNWSKLFDEALIPYDFHGKDGGMITTSNMPVFERDKIRVHYSDSNFLHGFREKEFDLEYEHPTFVTREATFRRDGFVYAYSNDGEITTKPIDVTHKQIYINADSTGGEIRVHLMQAGKLQQSFNLSDIDTLGYRLQTTAQGEVEFVIVLKNAKFYSLDIV